MERVFLNQISTGVREFFFKKTSILIPFGLSLTNLYRCIKEAHRTQICNFKSLT